MPKRTNYARVSINFCKLLETLKSEINSLYHLKTTWKPLPTGQHCFISSSQFFQRLSGHFTKTSSKQNEIAGKVSLTLFRYFIVSPVFIAALDVSVMGGMILQWVSYFCQNNVKHKFSSQCTYKPRQLGLRICQRYFKNITILLCQATFTKYDYDKCQRKNRSGFFL